MSDRSPPGWSGPRASRRSSVLRNAFAVGAATGAYGVSFGALSVAAGLSVLQTDLLSLLMFTGGSQFALVLTLGAGGGPIPAVGSAALLGLRNAFYGLRIADLLGRPRGAKRLLAAQLTIDETTAMALGQDDPEASRLAFWATGASVYALWNAGTLAGAFGAQFLPDPKALGLDAAAPAAFLALLAPRLRGREPWLVAAGAAVVALALVPVVPAGIPVLVAALVAVAVGFLPTPPTVDSAGPAGEGGAVGGAGPAVGARAVGNAGAARDPGPEGPGGTPATTPGTDR